METLIVLRKDQALLEGFNIRESDDMLVTALDSIGVIDEKNKIWEPIIFKPKMDENFHILRLTDDGVLKTHYTK